MEGNKDAENSERSTGGQDNGKLDTRLEQLNAQLSTLRSQEDAEQRQQAQRQSNSSGFALAWRLGAEFIAGVLVGGVIGYLIDMWLGWSPWGLIIFLLLGFVAGMLNMLRAAGKLPPPGGA
ncbi:ATP synthase protein I [Cohaesibacter sp. ES.047]|uniref:AtpZ/AtpI family protein n=1 Tax=Cohaesibacter sp. ES.047 TaxID=1798205 RepID=UPI000BB6A8CA|nr:AtpZ/AtpI family protein [Cohaesibacter sp. ES.047]SNY92544.1 ATP synthase protein I [Cohaesibacter sp. ES.047]